ncbi:hypothetical protein BJ878DRAFT_542600 [Calycina marina]|uniref:Uncharacterized protein n=1 Tax=Calycina marina TaxID=1763456 RepID=A0A9P7Z2D7_9HELO|nr:hypothetical protein BJ878DRAFT_542600 [Calycina marina]
MLTTHLNVSYLAFKEDIAPGKKLDFATGKSRPQPAISFTGTEASTTYTFTMLDPIVGLANGSALQILHGNVSNATSLSLASSSSTATYISPALPPENPT